jgi:DNA repair protein SbcC/Rad50
MNIAEYAIRRYGPLRDSGRVSPGGFTLFYGYNEYGKTLTIDALVKLLFGKTARREFTAIHRVDEVPDGYAVIHTDDGAEIKLPEQGTLLDAAGLSPSECSNIFIIRNSDLSIANERSFYERVTDRLTGLRTTYIEQCVRALQDLGNLTPTGLFRDTAETRLKSRLESAAQLVPAIQQVRADAESSNLQEIEREYVAITDRLRTIGSDIERLGEARLREKYEKGRDALDRLTAALESLETLRGFSERDEQRWRDNERDIEGLRRRRDEAAGELETRRRELQEIAETVRNLERQWQGYETRKRELDETIRPLLREYEQRSSFIPQYESRRKFFGTGGLVSALLLAIAMIGALISSDGFFFGIAAFFCVLLLVSGGVYYYYIRRLAERAVEFNRLITAAARFGFDADSLPRIAEKVQTFEDERQRERERLEDGKRERDALQRRVDDLTKQVLPDIDKTIGSLREEIDALRRTSGEESLDSYRQLLRQKNEQKKNVDIQRSLLGRDFPGGADGNEIGFWRNEIDAIHVYSGRAAGVAYDENEYSRLTREDASLRGRLKAIAGERDRIAVGMKDVERKANEILQTGDEYSYCNTLGDLVRLEGMLRSFIDSHETARAAVLAAIDVFGGIQREEEQKIGTLFGRDRPVSEFFNTITGGKYTEVVYDQDAGLIETVGADGSRLPAAALSGGAYDQLYFCIRLALGEELLKGESGFFILDDPFIKSDEVRLRDQMQMLRHIAGRGWQILYFSAKTEVLAELNDDIAAGTALIIDFRKR